MPLRGLTRRDLYSTVIFAALVYFALRFISQIADVLLLFSITLLAVVVLNPVVTWLECRRIPRAVSAALLALSVIGLVVLALYLVIPLASKQMSELAQQLPQSAEALQRAISKLADKYPVINKLMQSLDNNTLSALKPLLGGATRLTANIAGLIAAMLVAFISTIYILANPKPLANGLLLLFTAQTRRKIEGIAEHLGKQIQAWSLGLLIGMFAIFLLTWVALSIIGIKQAFLFAVFAGLLEAVPILGPVLSAVPPIVVALTYNPVLVIWIILAFIIIQQFESNILVPMVMSRQLSLHPVTVIFAVVVLNGMFGIIGIFLATPAAATISVLYDELHISRQVRKLDDGSQETSRSNRGGA